MSQVYGFVKQSGGEIKIYSEVGQGTTIRIYLPRAAAAPRPSGQGDAPVVGSSGSETVLVVEDECDVRSYLVETLKDLNYRVREAANGAAALALFDANPFRIDLLLTDIVMPGLNGRELADQLHHRQSGLRVSVHDRLFAGCDRASGPAGCRRVAAAEARHPGFAGGKDQEILDKS